MWTIRQEQANAFRQRHLTRFEDEMVEHLRQFAPKLCKIAGEASVRQVIRTGMENSGKYGFTSRGPVRFYIELMLMFGSEFDSDPQCFWASRILNNTAPLDEANRADRLYGGLQGYMAEVHGPDQQHRLAALRRASQVKMGQFISSRSDLENSILFGLHSIHPEKYDYVGEPIVRQLFGQCFDLAHRLELTGPEEIALVSLIAFTLGYRWFADPLFRSLSAALLDGTNSDSNARRECLLETARLFFLQLVAEDRQP